MRKHHNKSLYNRNYIRELSPMFTTWSLNFNDGMPLVKGSTIIHSVLMCSITIFLSLTRSLMAIYLMSMCLIQLPLLLFFAIKTAIELSQYILNGLDIESITLKPGNETLKPYTMWSSLKTSYELSFHSRINSQGLLNAPPRYNAIGQDKNVSRCWFTWINTTSKVWIWVANNL